MKNFLFGFILSAVLFTAASWAMEKPQIVPLNELYDLHGTASSVDHGFIVPAFQYVAAECYTRNQETGEMEPIARIAR